MSEATSAVAAPLGDTAGSLLRKARQAQGLHIAALATSIKVTPRKLEMLESDRYDELTDATFTRALAQAVCRALKIDSSPVLALLPPLGGYRIEHVAEGLNAPFHERPGRMVPNGSLSILGRPALWAPAILLVGAALVYFMPQRQLLPSPSPAASDADAQRPEAAGGALPVVAEAELGVTGVDVGASASAPNASEKTVAVAAAEPAPVPVPASELPASAGPSGPSVAAPDAPLELRARRNSWVEVVDAKGQVLLSRVVKPGEVVGLDGPTPMKVRIGNAVDTQLTFRGQPFAIAEYTRDNIARFELK